MNSLWSVLEGTYGDFKKRLAHHRMLIEAAEADAQGWSVRFVHGKPHIFDIDDAESVSITEVENNPLGDYSLVVSSP